MFRFGVKDTTPKFGLPEQLVHERSAGQNRFFDFLTKIFRILSKFRSRILGGQKVKNRPFLGGEIDHFYLIFGPKTAKNDRF